MNILDQNIAYAFTIRKNCPKAERADVKEDDYKDYINMLDARFNLKDFYYEVAPKYKVLHVHGIVEMPKSQKYTELKVKGFSTKFRKIFNMENWVSYIKKNQDGNLARELRRTLFPSSKSACTFGSVTTLPCTICDEVDSPIDPPDDFKIPKKKLF